LITNILELYLCLFIELDNKDNDKQLIF